jgi:hypothetical protein
MKSDSFQRALPVGGAVHFMRLVPVSSLDRRPAPGHFGREAKLRRCALRGRATGSQPYVQVGQMMGTVTRDWERIWNGVRGTQDSHDRSHNMWST